MPLRPAAQRGGFSVGVGTALANSADRVVLSVMTACYPAFSKWNLHTLLSN